MNENELRQQIRKCITEIIAIDATNPTNKILNENLPDELKGKDFTANKEHFRQLEDFIYEILRNDNKQTLNYEKFLKGGQKSQKLLSIDKFYIVIEDDRQIMYAITPEMITKKAIFTREQFNKSQTAVLRVAYSNIDNIIDKIFVSQNSVCILTHHRAFFKEFICENGGAFMTNENGYQIIDESKIITLFELTAKYIKAKHTIKMKRIVKKFKALSKPQTKHNGSTKELIQIISNSFKKALEKMQELEKIQELYYEPKGAELKKLLIEFINKPEDFIKRKPIIHNNNDIKEYLKELGIEQNNIQKYLHTLI